MQNNKKTIVITGSTGFIGSDLIKSFLQDNYKVIAVIRKETILPKGCIHPFVML